MKPTTHASPIFPDRKYDAYRLRSRRVFGANLHIIGINPELDVFEGYDSELHSASLDGAGASPEAQFTPTEKMELGFYMMGLWKQYAIQAGIQHEEWDRDKAGRPRRRKLGAAARGRPAKGDKHEAADR